MKYLKLLLASSLILATTAFSQVNINTASAKELMALKGIGEKKAQDIIKYRKANGKFKTVTDLTQVKGIGEATVKKLGSDIKVSGTTNLDKLKNKSAAKATKPKSSKKTGSTKPSKKSSEKKKTSTTKTIKKKTDKSTNKKKKNKTD